MCFVKFVNYIITFTFCLSQLMPFFLTLAILKAIGGVSIAISISQSNWPVSTVRPYAKVIIKLKLLETRVSMNYMGPCVTAQPVKGMGSEAIPACYALANWGLGMQSYPNMQCIQNTSYKIPAKSQKDEEGEGRDFSDSLS